MYEGYERLTFMYSYLRSTTNQLLLSSPIIYLPALNRFTVYLPHPLRQYCPHFSYQHPNKVRLQIFQQPIILYLIFPTSLYSPVLVARPSSNRTYFLLQYLLFNRWMLFWQ